MLKSKASTKEKAIYNEDNYNYLAIGNSITIHNTCEYWWGKYGMAASQKENDYYHLIVNELLKDRKVTSYICGLSVWEELTHDRNQGLQFLDSYLDEQLDLITIQLSENMSDISTLTTDFIDLINYIKQKCPNTKIILIDDFWDNEKSNLKKKVAEESDVGFADLSLIRNKNEYMSEMGAEVIGDDGNVYIINHEGVAKHPNNLGMKYIAEQVLGLIR